MIFGTVETQQFIYMYNNQSKDIQYEYIDEKRESEKFQLPVTKPDICIWQT